MQIVSNPIETIRKKCQILFSGKIKNTVINLSSAEFCQRVVKVNYSLLLLLSVTCNCSWHFKKF